MRKSAKTCQEAQNMGGKKDFPNEKAPQIFILYSGLSFFVTYSKTLFAGKSTSVSFCQVLHVYSPINFSRKAPKRSFCRLRVFLYVMVCSHKKRDLMYVRKTRITVCKENSSFTYG